MQDIAQEADVPLGNVYYYFKTKEAIGEAVIEKRAAEYAEFFVKLDENSDPRARLFSLLQFNSEDLELIARYGCSVGGLVRTWETRGIIG